MADILDEAQSLLQCKNCPWYKNCVIPVRVSENDLRKQAGGVFNFSTPPGMDNTDLNLLLSSLASAAENSILEGCPVFIDRLRSTPGLALRIKKMMQNWAEESKDDSPPQDKHA